jgi:hypothetical protein
MTDRLCFEECFLGLANEVHSLRHLTHIAEKLTEEYLTQSGLNLSIREMQQQGYTVVVLNRDQYRAFDFLIGHLGDTACRADELIDAVETLAMKYVRARA